MRRAPAALVVAAWVCFACGGDSSKPAPAPLAASAPPSAPPASQVPEGNLRGDAAAGAQMYGTYCASCHGPEGKGDGPVAQTLVPPPANHTDHAYMSTLSDAQLYTVISKGGTAVGKSQMMAPWGGVVNDEGIRDLIAYIRKLSGT